MKGANTGAILFLDGVKSGEKVIPTWETKAVIARLLLTLNVSHAPSHDSKCPSTLVSLIGDNMQARSDHPTDSITLFCHSQVGRMSRAHPLP